MVLDKTAAIAVSATLFGLFVLAWILSIVLCKCRSGGDEASSDHDKNHFSLERELMMRQNSERRPLKSDDAATV